MRVQIYLYLSLADIASVGCRLVQPCSCRTTPDHLSIDGDSGSLHNVSAPTGSDGQGRLSQRVDRLC